MKRVLVFPFEVDKEYFWCAKNYSFLSSPYRSPKCVLRSRLLRCVACAKFLILNEEKKKIDEQLNDKEKSWRRYTKTVLMFAAVFMGTQPISSEERNLLTRAKSGRQKLHKKKQNRITVKLRKSMQTQSLNGRLKFSAFYVVLTFLDETEKFYDKFCKTENIFIPFWVLIGLISNEMETFSALKQQKDGSLVCVKSREIEINLRSHFF